VELTIGIQMVAPCAPTWLMVERNKNSANRDVLPFGRSEASATKTIRKEVNVQCAK